MSSKRVVDLRKRKPGGVYMRPLSFGEPTPRRSSLKARRRRHRAIVAFGILTIVVALGYGVSHVSYLPRFSVSAVKVDGAEEIRPALVRALAESVLYDGHYSFLSGTNILFYPRAKIERMLAEYFPRVHSTRVSRDSLLATAIRVTIEERAPYARWCLPAGKAGGGPSACYEMDEEGFIFAKLGSTTPRYATAYTFHGGVSATSSPIRQWFIPGNFPTMRVLLERLGQAGYATKGVSVDEVGDFSIGLSQGFELRISFGENVDTLVRNLELVLASDALRGKTGDLEYVDLRFGNRVYYKLKGEDEQSAE